ncbi:AMP-dependent synthetase and ligase OS=Tsukamurella paurometabola (strain ATCC 8368 / DSM /CCUG 35730 / CIP 100753 / JCM 10117 / KCTC 9821 / NBRC 16120/ NCIMB 702349 / NCTC 13040) OX=521096 GN=Tpau_3316 PE=3 SV=1 [Tsukamurella paurometabola]|uniref:AMP-dependent synthetase and ligase n=1 Tax=Tsukamurella paurometabola (strain ATCC 8368 / DSM 20162 / CCUG 35730 / CIP 100753 / JCM 10117 / KCTC 9821 / NBRC 16120 / NCIMB 702349 / NCTC 13040) TaxID=521096 RepID=D5UWA2_TSUPD|nr:AMP-binding protein [Tsukamurella paurometabola]ADG79901.1 AMP-dependent synthetase and ligase [Tsukamurella paurometabola DSM 20162]SUP37587.1 Short-chain-fatty-acid--CoA ligase [Tsukamurella paurometabola]
MTTPSYDCGDADPALLTLTIGAQLELTTDRYGDRTALVDVPSGRRWTYDELLAAARSFAAGLVRKGIRRGDRVGVWAPNTPEWVIVQFGTALAGVILVNLNPSYRQRELEYALNQSGIVAVFTMTAFKTSEYAAMLEAARPEAPDLRDVVTFDGAAWAEYLAAPSDDELADLTDLGDQLSADDAINIQYTSGTTGFPKGATLTHRNILNNGYLVGELLNYTEQDSICIPVPFYHCFGMVMGNLAAVTHGAAMVIPGPAFVPQDALAAVAAEKCTSLYGVPTMFIAELALAEFDSYDLSSLRTGIMAGSPCPEEVMRKVVDRMGMTEVSICYGMTETSPVSTQTRIDDALELRVGTVGRVGPHLEIRVIDPIDGTVMPRGEVGELCTRGYSVMKGYWNNEEKTAEAIDAEGWMHTGDLATMDDAGYVRVTGRIKDMVIRGGENIYPREIEEFLYTHPDILDAQVIGVPDEKYGEELMAWIQLREGVDSFTVEDLKAFAEGKIARHKIPRYVHVVTEFPMTVSGKIRKVQMREESVELLGLGE